MQIYQRTRCFLETFTQLAQILHDRRSRRSWQISSLRQRKLNAPRGWAASKQYGQWTNVHPSRLGRYKYTYISEVMNWSREELQLEDAMKIGLAFFFGSKKFCLKTVSTCLERFLRTYPLFWRGKIWQKILARMCLTTPPPFWQCQ